MAAGTAAALVPIRSITAKGDTVKYIEDSEQNPGPACEPLIQRRPISELSALHIKLSLWRVSLILPGRNLLGLTGCIRGSGLHGQQRFEIADLALTNVSFLELEFLGFCSRVVMIAIQELSDLFQTVQGVKN